MLAGVAAESRRFRLRRFPAQDSPQPWRISPLVFSGPHPVLRPSRYNLPRWLPAWGDLVFRPEPGPRVLRPYPALRPRARLPRRQGRGKRRSLGIQGTFPATPEFLLRFLGAKAASKTPSRPTRQISQGSLPGPKGPCPMASPFSAFLKPIRSACGHPTLRVRQQPDQEAHPRRWSLPESGITLETRHHPHGRLQNLGNLQSLHLSQTTEKTESQTSCSLQLSNSPLLQKKFAPPFRLID